MWQWDPRTTGTHVPTTTPSFSQNYCFTPLIPSPSSSSFAPSEESNHLLLRFLLLFCFPSLDSKPNFTLATPIFDAFSSFTTLGVARSLWFEENWSWSISETGGRGAGFGGSRREMCELELVQLGDYVELVQLAPGEFDPDSIRLPDRNRVRTYPDHDVWVHMNPNCVLGSNPAGRRNASRNCQPLPPPPIRFLLDLNFYLKCCSGKILQRRDDNVRWNEFVLV